MVASMRSAGSPFLDNTAGMVWNLVLERRSTPPTMVLFFWKVIPPTLIFLGHSQVWWTALDVAFLYVLFRVFSHWHHIIPNIHGFHVCFANCGQTHNIRRYLHVAWSVPFHLYKGGWGLVWPAGVARTVSACCQCPSPVLVQIIKLASCGWQDIAEFSHAIDFCTIYLFPFVNFD